MCIDVLGAVAARLVADNKVAEEEARVHALVMAAREAVTGRGWRKGGGVGSSGGGTTSCAKLIV